MWPFFQFPVWARSFRLTAWLLIVVSHRIVRGFDRYGSTQAVALIYPRLLTEFGKVVFFTSLTEFWVRYLGLSLLSTVLEIFRWFWMGSLYKNIHLMPELLKSPFLVLYFYYNTLMTFLIMLSVILLSMLMILLSTLYVTRHLTCGNN